MRSGEIKKLQERRFALLQRMYERTKGDTHIRHDTEGLRCEFGLDQREMESIVGYLADKGFLVEGTRGAPLNHGSALRLTHKGVDEVEKTLAPEEKQATNGNVIHAQNIINSPIQQGTTDSTQTVSFGPGVEADIREVLAWLKAELPGLELEAEHRQEMECDIQTVESQLDSPRPKVGIIRASLAALYDVSLKVTGGVITSEIAPKIHHLLQQLPHWHP